MIIHFLWATIWVELIRVFALIPFHCLVYTDAIPDLFPIIPPLKISFLSCKLQFFLLFLPDFRLLYLSFICQSSLLESLIPLAFNCMVRVHVSFQFVRSHFFLTLIANDLLMFAHTHLRLKKTQKTVFSSFCKMYFKLRFESDICCIETHNTSLYTNMGM